MSQRPTRIESELRSASDRLLATLDEIVALEEEKRALAPGSQRFVELAGRIEHLAHAVLRDSRAQEQLARTSETLVGSGAAAPRPIDEVPPRAPAVILAEWREAERRLQEAPPGSAEREAAAAEVRRLRDEYQRAFDSARTD